MISKKFNLGYGTWKMNTNPNTFNLLKCAYDHGYRLFDTAKSYGTESIIGEFLNLIDCRRDDIFITTKISNHAVTRADVINEVEDSLRLLGVDYIDLVLIHWPAPLGIRGRYKERNREVYVTLESFVKNRKIKYLGLSNFMVHHLNELLPFVKIAPIVNQIECHPYFVDHDLINFCRENGMMIQAFSPLGRGSVLENKEIRQRATELGVTPAQLIIAWHLYNDRLVVTNSSKKENIISNFNARHLVIDKSINAFFDKFNSKQGRIISHPDTAQY